MEQLLLVYLLGRKLAANGTKSKFFAQKPDYSSNKILCRSKVQSGILPKSVEVFYLTTPKELTRKNLK